MRGEATHSVRSLGLGFQPNELNHGHLHQLIHRIQAIQHADKVPDCDGLSNVAERHKRVSLARCVGFGREKGLKEFGRVGDEVFVGLVDCENGKDGVFADKGVAVLLQRVLVVKKAWVMIRTRQLRTVGTSGSKSSTSLIFCSIRRVAPRMYSLGCCCWGVSFYPRGDMQYSRDHFG